MTIKEMLDKINEIREQLKKEDNWEYIGVRFENKERKIGDICEPSKHNPDREDEREFPEYDTEEYKEMPEREGTCAWSLRHEFILDSFWLDRGDREISFAYDQKHCYIIAGNKKQHNVVVDEDEIIIIDAEVVAQVF